MFIKPVVFVLVSYKYYGILLDSTPDLGHREQLSQVIRFVDVDFQTKKVTIKESFLVYMISRYIQKMQQA